MLIFCEACNGCSFYILSGLIENLLAKSYYMKISLPMSLTCFLIFLPNFILMFLIDMFLIKKLAMQKNCTVTAAFAGYPH